MAEHAFSDAFFESVDLDKVRAFIKDVEVFHTLSVVDFNKKAARFGVDPDKYYVIYELVQAGWNYLHHEELYVHEVEEFSRFKLLREREVV